MACKTKNKYGVGGSLGSLTGAALGTFLVPGLGTTAGAALGNYAGNFIEDMFGNNNNNQDNNFMHSVPNNTIIQNQNYTQTPNIYGNSMSYAFGGPLKSTQYKGNTHEQGGIAIGPNDEVEDGEVRIGNYIFSNRLRVPNTNKTFAQMAKNLENKYKGNETDTITDNTLKRELAKLAQTQENIRQNMAAMEQQQQQQIEQTQQFAYGGDIPPEGDPENKKEKQNKSRELPFPLSNKRVQHGLKKLGFMPYKTSFGDVYNTNSPIGWINNQRQYKKATKEERYEWNLRNNPYYDKIKEVGDYLDTIDTNSYGYNELQTAYDRVKSYSEKNPIKEDTKLHDDSYQQMLNSMFKIYDLHKYYQDVEKREKKPNNEYKYGGIYIKPENRGKFTDYCGGKVTEECIQKGLNSPNPLTRKRANFARNARKWHWDGGDIPPGGIKPTDLQEGDNTVYYTDENGTQYAVSPGGISTSTLKRSDGKTYQPMEISLEPITITGESNNLTKEIPKLSKLPEQENPYFLKTKNNISEIKTDLENQTDKDKFLNIEQGNLNLNLGDLSKTGLSTLGGLYDIYRGLKGGEYEYYSRLSPLQLQKMDPTKAIQDVRQQSQYAATKVKNVGGQGLGQYLNNIQGLNTNTQKAISDIRNKYNQTNVGIENQQRQLNSAIQEKNINLDVMQNDINARERDFARNTLQHGLTTLSQGLNRMFVDQSMRDVQDQTIRNLIESKNFTYIKDNNGNYILTSKKGNKYRVDINNKVYDENGNYLGTVEEVFTNEEANNQ